MSKVYLLLRNNQQTGPFTLQEILQLNLKPFDLVWEEGRSAAWRYPAEIESLQPFVLPTPQPETPFEPIATSAMEIKTVEQESLTQTTVNPPAQKKVFVSLPRKTRVIPLTDFEEPVQTPHNYADPVFEKAEEIPHKIAVHQPVETTSYLNDQVTREPYYYRPVKKNNSFSKKWLVVAIVLVVVTVGWLVLSQPSAKPQNAVANKPLTIPAPSSNENPATSQPDEEINLEERVDENRLQEPKETFAKHAGINVQKKLKTIPTPEENIIVKTSPVIDQQKALETPDEELVETRTATEPAASKKEKKKLRDVVKGIFSKKNQAEEPVIDEPVTLPDRQSRKRESESQVTSEPELSVLAENIDITTHAPDNWMMGIKGLKITLRNRNHVALQSAAITVSYYDGNNKLLEKKSLTFQNVPANGKLTLPAPDHKWADHIETSLGNISIRKDVYARE